MLHINKVSASHQAKPHPYMRRVYLRLDSLEAQDFGRSDGTLVQSFRSVVDEAPPGWIWFNVSSLNPSMLGAELVLFRKTLHPRPLSVTVTLHSVTASQGALQESPALEERLLTLDQRPSSGYDVFDVSAVLAVKPVEVVGFQLRYTDESGSLVLHEALTQSLYCLSRGSLRRHGGPVLSIVASQQEGSGFEPWAWCLSVWSLHVLPVLIGDLKVPIDVKVSASGCLSLYVSPVIDWRPVQSVPRPHPVSAGISSSLPATLQG
uniref:TGF-beta propeptide domain-containing protein n=1 Tax=Seriola dumerili TaxID=41447 RepID=A0A3B4TCE7_SERDU